MKERLRVVARFAIGLAVVAAGFGVRHYLVATRPAPERVAAGEARTLVEVTTATRGDHDVALHAQGTVVPARQIVVVPQVGGRILWIADELVPGGRFRAGQPLVRIDPSDYAVQVELRAADLNRAELERRVEASRARVAEREWELFDERQAPSDAEGRELALRRPQLATADVTVRAAESAVKRARLDLRRTGILAPFNAFVQSESVDLGQVVGPTSAVATLVGSDAFWVQVSVPVDALAHVQIPGARATVHQVLGTERIERTGRVLRLLGDLDPAGQMARLLVEIEDPLGLARNEPALPLLLGAYVRVEIAASPVRGAIEIPRTALRDGERVFVMSDAGSLEIREVTIAWRLPGSVLVRSGIEPGERIVTSRIASPVAGMPLRARGEDDRPDGAPRAEATR